MQKILLFPLRLLVGWGLSPRLLGFLGVTMLVLLRLTVGWHFYSEGVDKLESGKWDAAPFFANARGPFADQYHKLVWDHDGKLRRDIDENMLWLAYFRDCVGDHYGFTHEQKVIAQQNYADVVAKIQKVLDENAADLEEYDLGLKRIEELNKDPAREGVDSLRGQRDTIRKEREGKLRPVMNQIDQIWKNYETTQNDVATPEQKRGKPKLYAAKPEGMDTSLINAITPYFDVAVGLCLLFGLFTPLVALAAAGFLGSVFLSQFPPVTGPSSTYYQLVECMACLTLAATAAGRFAGLDYFLHMIVRKVWGTEGDDT